MGRISRRTLISAPISAFALAPLLRSQEPPEPVFKVDVRLVRMLVTVKNEHGQLVGGINKDEFSIFDNGVPQEIALFERHTSQPLSIAVLVDTSRSTQKERRYELESVKRFFRRLLKEGRDDDTVALYSFNTDVTIHTPFTHDLKRAERGLGTLRSEGATSLYDAVWIAARNLRDRPGRHVVLVVSDGGDTTSRVRFGEALEALHGSDAVLYSVLVVPVPGEAGRNLRGENALFTFSQWTGGKLFAPALGAGMDDAFDQILNDLRTQYLLGFYPRNVPPTKERFHSVNVVLARPRHSVQARNGYFSDDVVQPAGFDGPKRPQ